jgi:hypothetical protein
MARGKKLDPDFELFAQMKAKSKAEGFREGYRRALFDLRNASYKLQTEFEEGKTRAASPTMGDIAQAELPHVPPRSRAPRANSDQARVLAVIAAKPGMRGMEIVQALATGSDPVHERTVRTALARLKGKKIERRGSGWYPMPG